MTGALSHMVTLAVLAIIAAALAEIPPLPPVTWFNQTIDHFNSQVCSKGSKKDALSHLLDLRLLCG